MNSVIVAMIIIVSGNQGPTDKELFDYMNDYEYISFVEEYVMECDLIDDIDDMFINGK